MAVSRLSVKRTVLWLESTRGRYGLLLTWAWCNVLDGYVYKYLTESSPGPQQLSSSAHPFLAGPDQDGELQCRPGRPAARGNGPRRGICGGGSVQHGCALSAACRGLRAPLHSGPQRVQLPRFVIGRGSVCRGAAPPFLTFTVSCVASGKPGGRGRRAHRRGDHQCSVGDRPSTPTWVLA